MLELFIRPKAHLNRIKWAHVVLMCAPRGVIQRAFSLVREDVKIPTYKPHTNHKRSSVRSHTLAQTSICDLAHSLCWRPLTDLGHISSVTYVCHPLWFVCGHRKGILKSPLYNNTTTEETKATKLQKKEEFRAHQKKEETVQFTPRPHTKHRVHS